MCLLRGGGAVERSPPPSKAHLSSFGSEERRDPRCAFVIRRALIRHNNRKVCFNRGRWIGHTHTHTRLITLLFILNSEGVCEEAGAADWDPAAGRLLQFIIFNGEKQEVEM